MSTLELLLDDNRGVYIPLVFATQFDMTAWNVPVDLVTELRKGPDNEVYWGVWDEVLRDAFFVSDGKSDLKAGKWYLDQDGSLFARHEDHQSEDEGDEA